MKKRSPKLKLPGKFDPQRRWFVWYFLTTLLVLWDWQEFSQQIAVRAIPYSQFKAHLARREVIEAAVKQYEVVGRIVPLAARQTNAAPAGPVITALRTNEDIPFGWRRALRSSSAPSASKTPTSSKKCKPPVWNTTESARGSWRNSSSPGCCLSP